MHDLPASIRFDRIEVSNILDAQYVGMRGVLTHWASLLVESNIAAIVGYFMNWVVVQTDGMVSEAGPSVIDKLFCQTMERRKVRNVPTRRSRLRVTHELHFKLNLKIHALDSSRSLRSCVCQFTTSSPPIYQGNSSPSCTSEPRI